jgi:hypothetical protein
MPQRSTCGFIAGLDCSFLIVLCRHARYADRWRDQNVSLRHFRLSDQATLGMHHAVHDRERAESFATGTLAVNIHRDHDLRSHCAGETHRDQAGDPPSIRCPFLYGTGTLMPGTAADAWIARPGEPLSSRTTRPLSRSVATAANRTGNFSIGAPPVSVSI